ncbi:MAG: pyridoxamine 5'-phosphate oxidase family protein [Actinomycetales bacterium]|nr:pyridoxamine 5'-phosphate oxidase family protein [Actinomycetales bacterium]
MSIPVDLAALGEALGRHHTAYLLLGSSGRPHVAQVFPRLVDDLLIVAEPGRTARRIVPDSPEVTVMMPPTERGGYTLIIDGAAVIRDDGALELTPTHAVLHRASDHRAHETHDSACGNDCQPIDAQT